MSKYVIGVLIPIIVLLTGCQSHTIQQNKEEARGSYSTEINNGEIARVLDENWAFTKMSINRNCFEIDAAKGNLEVIPATRTWKLVFVATEDNSAQVYADGNEVAYSKYYDKETQNLIIEINEIDVTKKIKVEFKNELCIAKEEVWSHCNRILERSQASYEFKARAIYAIENQGKNAIATLMTFNLDRSINEALIEVLTARNIKS